MRKIKKYELELALEKLIDEIRKSIKRASNFWFTIPKNKMDKYAWLIETCSWLLLGLAMIIRLTGR